MFIIMGDRQFLFQNARNTINNFYLLIILVRLFEVEHTL